MLYKVCSTSAMYWSMAVSKDFISFCKSAEKKYNLINWWILPKSPPPPNSIAPKTIVSRSPCAPLCSLVPFYSPFVKVTHFWLIVVLFTSFCSHLRLRRILIFIFFVASFAATKWLRNAPRRSRAPSLMSLHRATPTFGWLLCPPI